MLSGPLCIYTERNCNPSNHLQLVQGKQFNIMLNKTRQNWSPKLRKQILLCYCSEKTGKEQHIKNCLYLSAEGLVKNLVFHPYNAERQRNDPIPVFITQMITLLNMEQDILFSQPGKQVSETSWGQMMLKSPSGTIRK